MKEGMLHVRKYGINSLPIGMKPVTFKTEQYTQIHTYKGCNFLQRSEHSINQGRIY